MTRSPERRGSREKSSGGPGDEGALRAARATCAAPAAGAADPARAEARPPVGPGGRGGTRGIFLLHGLVSTGDVFGAAFDRPAAGRRLVVPDLLGFGRSLDEGRGAFTLADHLDALDEVAARTGLFDTRPLVVGAHSLGSSLALHWARRHPGRVDGIVCWGAPVYRDAEAVRARLRANLMTRLFVLDTPWARRACALNCRHRRAAGWFAAVTDPSLPVPVARAASLHTWPAYRDALRHLVLEVDWARLLDPPGPPVRLVWGDADPVGDRDLARRLAADRPRVTVAVVPGADHHLPLAHPEVCLAHLRELTAGATTRALTPR
ncbi:MAG: alpha/beta fold hydrolase [Actinomyces sp.]|nr:MAG: alpha/beta fold hydrolase [Actinomyces sp.]